MSAAPRDANYSHALLAAAMVSAGLLGALRPVANAEGLPAPAPQDAVLMDPLLEPPVLSASQCPTHRGIREFVGDGFILKVRGKCKDDSITAAVTQEVIGLEFADGVIRVQARVVSGVERARVRVYFRQRPSGMNGQYSLSLTPSTRIVALTRTDTEGASTTLISKNVTNMSPEWNTLEVRALHDQFWVFLNGEEVGSATDSAWRAGRVSLDVQRLGDANDEDESAAVFRNLAVFQLDPSTGAQETLYRPVEHPPNAPNISIPVRQPGGVRIFTPDLIDRQVCTNLGMRDAQIDIQAGLDPNRPTLIAFVEDTPDVRECARAYLLGYVLQIVRNR